MQMKRIFPLLAIASLLAACHSQPSPSDKDYEAWMYYDNLIKIPMLPARIDSTLVEITPDTPNRHEQYPTKTSTSDENPFLQSFANEVTMLPLAPTPGFHIGCIEKIETDGDLLFVLGAETEDNGEDVFQYNIKKRAGFIFRRDGSLVAQLKVSNVSKDKDMVTMAVNREAKEISLIYWEKWRDCWGDLLSYDYEGNLLRHEVTYYDYANIMGYTQNHLVSNVRPPISDFAPQLTVYDKELSPQGFCLSRPSPVYTCDLEASLVSSGDELFYAAEYSDTIWQVTPEGTFARYLVRDDSLGIGSVAFDSTLTKSQRVLATENIYIPEPGIDQSLLVSPGFLLRRYIQHYDIKIEEETDSTFKWNHSNLHTILVYDRVSGHNCWAWRIDQYRFKLRGLCLTSAKALTEDGILISFHTPAQMKYYASHPDTYELDEKTQTFVKKLDIKANPVLLLMPLKHF